MNFLYPSFLFALTAVAIPILIHLFNFRRFKRIKFSNVAFLQEVKEQTSSYQRIKSLLILLARILAVILMVLAFAQPYWSNSSTVTAGKRNVVSIYIDNSYSMAAVDKNGSLFDEAKRRAKELVEGFGINDRFQLLNNDFEGKYQRLLTKNEFLSALGDIKISSSNRSLQQVINRQANIFQGDVNKFSYVISDFQQHFVGKEKLQVDESIRANFVKLVPNNMPNVAVDSAWFLSATHTPNGAEQLVVRFRNFGEQQAKGISAKITINGQHKALSNISLDAGKQTTDTLSFSGLQPEWQKGSVVIKDYPFTFDDELYFSFNVVKEQRILAINGDNAPKNIATLFRSDNYLKLTEMSEKAINYNRFPTYTLIILNALENPSSGLAQELKNYVANGGHLVVFPETAATIANYNVFLSQIGLPAIVALNKQEASVATLELKDRLFKGVFDELPNEIKLPVVKQYFSFGSSGNLRQDLLSLPAGNLFFSRFGYKKGNVYLSAVGLKADDGNFASHPLLVPLMYRIAFLSAKDGPLCYTLGNSQLITLPQINLSANQTLRLLGQNFEAIPETRQVEGATQLYLADQVKKAGFYDLKKGDSLLTLLSFNDSRLESDISYAPLSKINELLHGKNINVVDAGKESLGKQSIIQNNGTELWKLCLILALVFIAAEILLIKYYHPKNI